MATPKGTRTQHIATKSGEAVHIYSNPSQIVLHLRKEVPTEVDFSAASFKVAVTLTTQPTIFLVALPQLQYPQLKMVSQFISHGALRRCGMCIPLDALVIELRSIIAPLAASASSP